MNPLNIILTILLFLSGVLTVILVLMHSGKGTGVSDMIASSLYNAGTGSGILEKEDVDGALVGGASLKADSFSAMVKAAM